MRNNVSNFLVAFAGFLFLVFGSVVLTLNLREIYYMDIRNQQLEEYPGLSEEEIRANYDALIDYNLVTKGIETLELPSFPMSDHGRIHFEEVKRIFVVIQYLFGIMGILFLTGLIWKIRKREYRWLKLMAIMTFVIPALLGLMIGLCWEQFFVLFHKVFFRNDYWLFDPVTDPVILILPDSFFAHCAVAILLFIVMGGIISLAVYCWIVHRKRKRNDKRKDSRYNTEITIRR